MNKIILQTIVGIILLLGAVLPSLAAMPLTRGWYLEGNMGTSNLNDVSFGDGTSTNNTNAGFTMNLNAGYKFFPYFGLEGGYARFSNFNIAYENATVAKDEPNAYDLSTKIILPLQDSGFSLYAKVGVARVATKIVINDQKTITTNGLAITSGYTHRTGILYGVGGEYNFSPTTAFHVAWMQINTSSTCGNLATTSIGVSHLFG